jgi:hypothetical protein
MDALGYAMNLAKFTRGASDSMLDGWPQDKHAFQSAKSDNHPLWVIGHILSTDAWLASKIGLETVKVPESYGKLFGQGSVPSGNAKDYPSFAQLHDEFTKARAAILAWYEKATPEQLSKKIESGGFIVDAVDGLIKISWHEGWHFGQVAELRKAIGLPRKMG